MTTLNDLLVGDVLLVKGHNVLSKIISFATKSPYTHAACYMGRDLVVESTFGGVQVNSIYDYSKKEYDVFRHPTAKPEELNDAVTWMCQQVGKGYDYLGLGGIGISIIKKIDHNNFDKPNRYWCSELVADGYLKYKILLNVNQKTWKVSPGDLSQQLDLIDSNYRDVQ